MSNQHPTKAERDQLIAEIRTWSGPELMYHALTDDRLDWLDEDKAPE